MSMLTASSEKTLSKLLALGSASVTIFVLAGTVSDPVNATKFLLLGGVAVSSIFIFLSSGWKVIKQQRFMLVVSFVFLVASINTIINSKSPVVQNIYGTYGRNTGFLTYAFLIFIFISASTLSQKNSFKHLMNGLIFAGVVNIIYCLYVLTFGDFIGWNNPYGNILGTFGNPNFIGAFLGFFTSSLIGYSLTKGISLKIRFITGLTSVVALYEIFASHAIQGRVVFVAGIAIIGFYLIRDKFRSRTILITYSFSTFIVGFVALLGALQVGPLTKYIYKTSVSLRGEYWKAGISMAKSHLFSGVGFDSYGDWYRRSRDAQALILPGPETTSNAAHNVPIDVFAFGGLPLLIPYLAFVIMVIFVICKHTAKNREFDGTFVALVTAWIGYQIQSVISINQIGLAIWGWLLGGALIAYTRSTDSSLSMSKSERIGLKSKRQTEQVFSAQLIGGLGIVVGLIISCPPFSADSKLQSALKTNQLAPIETALVSTYMTPTDTLRLLQAVQILDQGGAVDAAHKYAKRAVDFNPENFDAWKILYSVKNATSDERMLAKKKMIELDPLNQELKKLP